METITLMAIDTFRNIARLEQRLEKKHRELSALMVRVPDCDMAEYEHITAEFVKNLAAEKEVQY